MRFQRLAPDHLPQEVSLFSPQRVSPFVRTRTTTTDRQTSVLAGGDRHVLGVRYEASPRGLHILEEPLLGELWLGQGLCKGLDISLHDVIVLGLITCVEVGLVMRLHLFFGGVRSVTTALKVVEEVQEGLQEIEDERGEEEVGWNGALKVEE